MPLKLVSKTQIGVYLMKLELGYQAVKSEEGKTQERRIEEDVSGGYIK